MAAKYKTILVPTDLTNFSETAFQQALTLARYYKLDIILLHVINPSKFGFFSKKQSYIEHQDECMLKLHNLNDKYNKGKLVNVKIMLEKDKLYKRIEKTSSMFFSRFVIVGFNSNSDIDSTRIKITNFLKQMKNSHSQILFLKGETFFETLRNILITIDRSEEARQKVPAALEFSKLYKSSINLYAATLSEEVQEINKLRLQLKQVNDYIESKHVNCTSFFEEKPNLNISLDDHIIEYSKKINCDLSIIMTNKSSNYSDPVSMLIKSKTPVLAVVSKKIGKHGGFN